MLQKNNHSTKKTKSNIYAIANQKGGVGKTTTAINLATGLAAVGFEVLIIDFDPQVNASTGLGIENFNRAKNSYSVMLNECSLSEATYNTKIPGLKIVPATVDLLGVEIELINSDRRSYRLRDNIEREINSYDFVLIDCPPALGLLTLNALTAANAIIVPLQCEFFALEGLSHLMKTIEIVKQKYNPDLFLDGVVLTMFDKRNNLSEQVAQDVRNNLGEKVFNTIIPRNVRISEAPSHGKPAIIYDYKCSGSSAYMKLAKEFINRKNINEAA